MANPKITFGKYKGKRLSKLPTEYLSWCLEKCDVLTDDLRQAVEDELASRSDAPKPDDTDDAPALESAGTRPIKVSPLGQSLSGDIRMMFRNLAFKYHPDRGGSPEAMQALNDFHEQLQDLIARTFSLPT